MAVKVISGCVGCGLHPCYHCKATVLECDKCGAECDELFELDSEDVCEDCFDEYMNELKENSRKQAG